MDNTELKSENQPKFEEKQITVPIKFNKEIKELTLEEAASLAQKGLKFEAIEKDFTVLRELASGENKSVPSFISEIKNRYTETKKQDLIAQCGGNEKLAEKILKLENPKSENIDFKELTEAFPEIKTADDLPTSVLNNIQLKGTNPLDEYLRFLLSETKKAKATEKKQKENETASTGSLANLKGNLNPETEEFLRGLWK